MTSGGDQPILLVHGGAKDGESVTVGKDTDVMGRLPENDVFVDEPVVSRKHAEIVRSDDGYFLRDLKSTNGTFVNSDRLQAEGDQLLRDGDEIRLGNGEISFTFRHFAASTLKMTIMEGAASDVPIVPAAPAPVDLDLYEGSVRLKVEAEGDVQQVVQFVQELRNKSQLRVLRLVSNTQKDLDILLGLREPTKLKDVLGEIVGVTEATPIGEENRQEATDGSGAEDKEERALFIRLGNG